MMRLVLLFALLAVSVKAADVTINDLTSNSSPSASTTIEVYDPSASPKSGKFSLSSKQDTITTNTDIYPRSITIGSTNVISSIASKAPLGSYAQSSGTVFWEDNFNRASLGTNWDTTGSPTIVLTNNESRLTIGDATSSMIYTNWFIATWFFKFTYDFRLLFSPSSTSYSFSAVQKASHDSIDNVIVFGITIDNVNTGRLYIGEGPIDSITNYATSLGRVNISANDSLHVSIECSPFGYLYSVTNSTSGSELTLAFNPNPNEPGTLPESGNMGFLFTSSLSGSTVAIDNVQLSCTRPNPTWMFWGDSITSGGSATNRYQMFPVIMSGRLAGGWSMEGRSQERSTSAARSIPEVVAINPKNIIYNVWGNDYGSSIPLSTTSNNVALIAAALPNTVIYYCPPTARTINNSDFSAVVRFSQTNYNSSFTIDTYGATANSTGTSMNPSYNTGDNVHPNWLGHAAIASAIEMRLSQQPTNMINAYRIGQ